MRGLADYAKDFLFLKEIKEKICYVVCTNSIFDDAYLRNTYLETKP